MTAMLMCYRVALAIQAQQDEEWVEMGRAILFLGMALLVVAVMVICIVLAVLVVVAIIAVVVGISLLLIALVAGGTITTSTIVGWRQRSVSDGFKAFVVQLAALAGLGAGVGAGFIIVWLARAGAQLDPNVWLVTIAGGVAGIGAGVLGGVLFNKIWYCILQWLLRRFGRAHTLDSSSYDHPVAAADGKSRHRDV